MARLPRRLQESNGLFLRKEPKGHLLLRLWQYPRYGAPDVKLQEAKVFCFFSSEKKIFLPF
jgi:hypothetical protein